MAVLHQSQDNLCVSCTEAIHLNIFWVFFVDLQFCESHRSTCSSAKVVGEPAVL